MISQPETRDYDAIVIGSGMTAVGGVAVLGLGAAWIIGEPILRWSEVPPELVADTAIALLVVLAVLVLRMTVGCTLEILGGLQRLDLTQRLNAISVLVEAQRIQKSQKLIDERLIETRRALEQHLGAAA